MAYEYDILTELKKLNEQIAELIKLLAVENKAKNTKANTKLDKADGAK